MVDSTQHYEKILHHGLEIALEQIGEIGHEYISQIFGEETHPTDGEPRGSHPMEEDN